MTTEPSYLFCRFIRAYPNSSSAIEWKKWHNDIPSHSGHFTNALYRGDIPTAIDRADTENQLMLRDLLFPQCKGK